MPSAPKHVRGMAVASLEKGKSKIIWGPEDYTVMIKHLAKHKIHLGNYKTHHSGEVVKSLDLSFTVDFNAIVHPKVQSALKYRLHKLEKLGHVKLGQEDTGVHWAVWGLHTRQWLSRNWDGYVGPARETITISDDEPEAEEILATPPPTPGRTLSRVRRETTTAAPEASLQSPPQTPSQAGGARRSPLSPRTWMQTSERAQSRTSGEELLEMLEDEFELRKELVAEYKTLHLVESYLAYLPLTAEEQERYEDFRDTARGKVRDIAKDLKEKGSRACYMMPEILMVPPLWGGLGAEVAEILVSVGISPDVIE